MRPAGCWRRCRTATAASSPSTCAVRTGIGQQFADFKDRTVQALFGRHDDLFLVSLRDAPRGKIEHIAIADLGQKPARTIVAEGKDAIETSFFGMPTIVATPNRLYVVYQLGGPSEIRAFDHEGKPAPGPETTPVAAFYELEPLSGDDLLFGSVSYVKPDGRYVFHAESDRTTETALASTSPVSLDDMEVRREFATSRDGTQVPVNILCRKGTKLDGSNPCLATGYGGYGVCITPDFSSNRRILLDQGFVIAIANVRGGGEFGEAWHLAGNLTHKQNVFDDFYAVLEHLIERKYTSSEHLAIVGGSNGGLLMGATLVQHPSLAKAVVSFVGIYDVLRTELSPNGEFNITEFGTVQEPGRFPGDARLFALRARRAGRPLPGSADAHRGERPAGRADAIAEDDRPAASGDGLAGPDPAADERHFGPRHRDVAGRADRRDGRRLRISVRPVGNQVPGGGRSVIDGAVWPGGGPVWRNVWGGNHKAGGRPLSREIDFAFLSAACYIRKLLDRVTETCCSIACCDSCTSTPLVDASDAEEPMCAVRWRFAFDGRSLNVVAWLIAVFVVLVPHAWANVKLPALFSEHMVLQRDMKVPIWGWADPGEKVTVTLPNQKLSAVADEKGRWQVVAEPLVAGGTMSLIVEGKNRIHLRDVQVGDVWLCSGQSNMEWSVADAVDADLEIPTANFPNLRIITVGTEGSQSPADNFDGHWDVCTSKTIPQFSAVGYFFGREMLQAVKVPIGIIDNSWGGSACEAWIRRDLMEGNPLYADQLATSDKTVADFNKSKAEAEFNRKLADWNRRAAAAKQRGDEEPPGKPWWANPVTGQLRPANLYNGRLKPIMPFAIRGVIWYQGETNADRAYQYRETFPLMVKNWRDDWGQGDFPFYWVQLADFMNEPAEPGDSAWAELREAQTMALDKVPKSGQAVIIDLGETKSIHPKNKQDVAKRLARLALAKTYKMTVSHNSPRYQSMYKQGDTILIRLKDVNGELHTPDDKPVMGFAIAGSDRKWRWAHATIVGKNEIEVQSDKVRDPFAVRYAWADNPVCNLYDSAGLPVTPFRTDSWPGVTVDAK